MNNPFDEIRLDSLIKACIRHFWYFIISLLLTGLLLGGFLLLKCVWKPSYVTTSTLLIYPKNTSSDQAEFAADGKLGAGQLGVLKETASSYMNLLNSRWVIYQALDNLNVAPDDTEEFITENVVVTNLSDSPYLNLEISYSDPDTSLAISQEIIRILPDILRDLNIEANLAVISYPILPTGPDLPSETILAVAAVGSVAVLGFLFVLFEELYRNSVQTEKDIHRVLELDIAGFLPKELKRPSWQKKKWADRAYAGASSWLSFSQSRILSFFGCPDEPAVARVLLKLSMQLIRAGYTVEILNLPGIKPVMQPENISQDYGDSLTISQLPETISIGTPDSISEYFVSLQDRKKESKNFLLINAPPFDSVWDAASLFTHSELSVMLLQHGKSKLKAAKLTLELARKAGAEKLCCLLFDIPDQGPCSYYSDFIS